MRILFLSNFYPPARPGGYQQLCQEVAERLKAQGHTIGILTSRHERENAPSDEPSIYRLLHLEGDLNYYQPLSFFSNWRDRHEENLINCEKVITEFKPDLIFIWGMWAMSQALAFLAERLLPGRVVYYLADYWPATPDMHTTYWTTPTRRRITRVPKRILGSLARNLLTKVSWPELEFRHVICVSQALRDNLVESGVAIEHARIIYNGIDSDQFTKGIRRDRTYNPLKLLYAGQLVPHKGVHTAIEAISILRNDPLAAQTHLTIIGSGHPHYISTLNDLVARENLKQYVTFQGPVGREEMPDILQQYDVLLFPSIYEEPLARMTQEAMFSGLVVVGTTTGGTKEILHEGENGLTFAPEDAAGLVRQLARLADNPELCQRLAEAGRQTVLAKFTLDRMINEIDAYLQEVVNDASLVSEQLLPTA